MKVSGKNLKKARAVQNISQEEAAKLLGINRCYLSLIENEKVIPSSQLQKRIDDMFSHIVDRFYFDF